MTGSFNVKVTAREALTDDLEMAYALLVEMQYGVGKPAFALQAVADARRHLTTFLSEQDAELNRLRCELDFWLGGTVRA